MVTCIYLHQVLKSIKRESVKKEKRKAKYPIHHWNYSGVNPELLLPKIKIINLSLSIKETTKQTLMEREMTIPRYEDKRTGIPYELYWKCTKCGWAIIVNNYRIGRDECRLCDSPTKEIRVDYPHLNIRNIDYAREI